MFLHFGYFLRKGLFLQKCSISAYGQSFCRSNTEFLQKAFGKNVSAETNLCAEIYFFLQKGRSFCQLRIFDETFRFLYPLFRFWPTPFRLISGENLVCRPQSVVPHSSLVTPMVSLSVPLPNQIYPLFRTVSTIDRPLCRRLLCVSSKLEQIL